MTVSADAIMTEIPVPAAGDVETRQPLRRVTYLIGSTPLVFDFERFGINYMVGRGIDVHVIDVSALCHPGIHQAEETSIAATKFTYRKATRIEDITAEQDQLIKADLIIALFTDGSVTWSNYPILKLLSRISTPYLLMCNNSIPGINNFKGEIASIHKRIYNIFSRRRAISLRNSIIARLPLRWTGLRPADYVVRGGKKSVQPRVLVDRSTRSIAAHSYDFERYLTTCQSSPQNHDHVIFIDQYIPHHRDWQLLKIDQPEDPDFYYAQLRRLFDRIENELGLQVIIAAHPRADYTDKPGVFGDRKIRYDQTTDLVYSSRLAITFTSMAVNFAVLAHKPVLLFASRRLYRNPGGQRYVDPLSRELNVPVVFLEDVDRFDLSNLLSTDDDAYRSYIENYLTSSDAAAQPLWAAITDAVSLTLSPTMV